MPKKRLLREYKRSLKNIRSYTKTLGLTDYEFENIFKDCLNDVETKECRRKQKTKFSLLYISFIFISLLILVYVINFLFNGKPFSFFFCKIQEFIYPGLRLLRIISVPIISTFPSLTELYDETCLIQNPFFRITDMDCWPCNSVTYITELKSIDFEPNSSPPFLYKTNQKEVTFSDLVRVYKENEKVFDKDASKIIINNKNTMLVSDFFTGYHLNQTYSKDGNSFVWRLNRMFPAQLIRTLFPRPDAIPRLGLSTERFVTMDEPGARPYQLGDPECNFVFVIQSQGERLVEMLPAPECADQCNPVTVLLTPPYLLWYNWWYWRPISHPTNLTISSISYMGSYC